MSIERNRFGFDGEISFECDACGNEYHAETASFEAALSKMKQEGWRAVKRKGDWEHLCPLCNGEPDDK
jgi:hypothetical protein